MSTYSFFLVCPLDLEQLCHQELLEKTADLVLENIQIQTGGISFKTSLGHGAALNHRLKIATRLLCQINEFRCRDLPKLFQKVSKMKWKDWLFSGQYKWKVSAGQSRLMHTGKIEQTLHEAVEKSFSHQAPKKRSASLDADFIPTLYARLQDDMMTLSIDLSGEPLYKRSDKIFSHHAPLRENLAQAFWRFFSQHLPASLDQIEFADPMAGSGTFFIEALTSQQIVTERVFAYQFIPQNFLVPLQAKLTQDLSDHFHQRRRITKVIVCDLDTQALESNWQRVRTRLEKAEMASEVSILKGDSFECSVAKPLHPRVILSNPPYGERLKKEFKVPELLALYRDKWQASYLGLLAPSSWDLAAHVKENQVLGKLKCKNGALAVCFWVIKL